MAVLAVLVGVVVAAVGQLLQELVGGLGQRSQIHFIGPVDPLAPVAVCLSRWRSAWNCRTVPAASSTQPPVRHSKAGSPGQL